MKLKPNDKFHENPFAFTEGEVVDFKFNNEFSNRYERGGVAAHVNQKKRRLSLSLVYGLIEFLSIFTGRRVDKVQPLTGCHTMD